MQLLIPEVLMIILSYILLFSLWSNAFYVKQLFCHYINPSARILVSGHPLCEFYKLFRCPKLYTINWKL